MKRMIAIAMLAAASQAADVVLGRLSELSWTGTGVNKTAAWGSADVLDGLVGRWTFDDVTGSMVPDDSGNGNAGTLDGGASVASGGVNGNALVLGATAGRVVISNATMTSVGSGDWTVTWWAKDMANSTAYGGVLIFNSYGVVMGGASDFSILLSDNANLKWPSPNTANWTFFAMTKNGTTYKVFSNGTEITSSAFADSGWGTSGRYEIGTGYNYPTYRFVGKLDDVRLYERALSADEAANIYNHYK